MTDEASKRPASSGSCGGLCPKSLAKTGEGNRGERKVPAVKAVAGSMPAVLC